MSILPFVSRAETRNASAGVSGGALAGPGSGSSSGSGASSSSIGFGTLPSSKGGVADGSTSALSSSGGSSGSPLILSWPRTHSATIALSAANFGTRAIHRVLQSVPT